MGIQPGRPADSWRQVGWVEEELEAEHAREHDILHEYATLGTLVGIILLSYLFI